MGFRLHHTLRYLRAESLLPMHELLQLNRDVQSSRAVRLLATQNLGIYATLMERHLLDGVVAETDLVVSLDRDLETLDEIEQSGLA